ncbi:general transcription factor II-I repeat domain-containing protein 2-like [Siphateles boraxobius]|uniref:general transcription factor II-I repeat domain-containing protein 2-like n=1 Tax=Siphateles boraxobius TaxID=180520 RepID=UPI0040637703
MVSEMIAKAGKPFKEGEFIKKCMLLAASKVCPEKKGQFSNISLSANTVAERISDLSENIYDQLREKAERFCAYSVALDESTDNTDTAQLAIYVRGVDDNFEVIEELLAVIPMHGQTTAQEIFRQLCGAIEDAGLPWKRFTGITTDGAPSMTGRKNGLVALVQRKLEEENVEEAIALHCIIHQQALCECLRFDNVMSVVVKCINHIRARGLKHWQFRAFLEEIESEYEDVLYFSDPKWLMDLAFLVDITQELNVLNKKLQGQGQLVSAAYDNVRFADFKTHRATFQIFADPFSFDVQESPPVLQMELIDLQCNSELKAKFREVSGNADKLGHFLRELPPTFPELSRMFKRTMCLFGSTYLCEKLFSTMNFNKSKYRSRLTDEHLQATLRVSTVSSLKPNVSQLCERKRCQVSGSKE